MSPIGIREVLGRLKVEFHIGDHDVLDLEAQLLREGIAPHVCRNTLDRLLARKNAGKSISSIKGYFITLARSNKGMTEAEALPKPVEKPKRSGPSEMLIGEMCNRISCGDPGHFQSGLKQLRAWTPRLTPAQQLLAAEYIRDLDPNGAYREVVADAIQTAIDKTSEADNGNVSKVS